jgi:hypothetical protein
MRHLTDSMVCTRMKAETSHRKKSVKILISYGTLYIKFPGFFNHRLLKHDAINVHCNKRDSYYTQNFVVFWRFSKELRRATVGFVMSIRLYTQKPSGLYKLKTLPFAHTLLGFRYDSDN